MSNTTTASQAIAQEFLSAQARQLFHHYVGVQVAGHGEQLNKTEWTSKQKHNPDYIGASKGAWQLLAIEVSAIVFTLIAVLSCVRCATRNRVPHSDRDEDSSSDEDSEDLGRSLLAKLASKNRPKPNLGFLQKRVFRADLNSRFAFGADLATRFTIVSLLCATTYWNDPLYQVVNTKGFSMQYVVVIIAFSLYGNLGCTVCLSWSGFYGTLIAVINCNLIMYCAFPHGVTADIAKEYGNYGVFSPAWWFGVIDYIVFTLFFLGLNSAANARMFALSWQAYFTLCFLNPNDDTMFSSGPSDILLDGNAVGPLISTIIGCLLAITCALVPNAITALGMAQDLALEVVWRQEQLLVRMHMSIEESKKSFSSHHTAVEAELHDLYQTMSKMRCLLDDAWWECFDLGRPGRVRQRLCRLQPTLSRMSDCFGCICQAQHYRSIYAQSYKGEAQMSISRHLNAELEDLILESTSLMFATTRAAVNGDSTSELEGQLMDATERVERAQHKLANAVIARRHSIGKGLTAENLGVHSICTAYSMYADCAARYAKFCMTEELDDAIGPCRGLYLGVKDYFNLDVLTSESHLKFLSRGCVAYWLATLLGINGIRNLYGSWNSTPPGTIAYLLSTSGHEGSAIKKNSDRFYGVCGGSMLGTFIFVLGCPNHWDFGPELPRGLGGSYWFKVIVVGVYWFISFYLYMTSGQWGYVGLLLAAFGAERFMEECTSDNAQLSQNVYGNLCGQLTAIFTAVFVDFIIGNSSASSLSLGTLQRLSTSLQESGNSILNMKGGSEMKFYRDEIRGEVKELIAQGHEASLEPRVRKTPWRDEVWAETVKRSSQLCIYNSLAQDFCTYVKEDDPAPNYQFATVSDMVAKQIQVPALRSTCEETYARITATLYLAKSIMGHVNEHRLHINEDDKSRLSTIEHIDIKDITATVDEVNKELWKSSEDSTFSEKDRSRGGRNGLMADDLSTASVLIMLFLAMNLSLSKLEERLMQEPDVWKEVDIDSDGDEKEAKEFSWLSLCSPGA